MDKKTMPVMRKWGGRRKGAGRKSRDGRTNRVVKAYLTAEQREQILGLTTDERRDALLNALSPVSV